MISLEQIAAVDATISAALAAYPGCKFLHVDLDILEIEDVNDEHHIFDIDTHEEIT
mgnify:CR=1 FL=1